MEILDKYCVADGCQCTEQTYAPPDGHEWATSGTTYENFFECTEANDVSLGEEFNALKPILADFEVELDCSGICSAAKLWIFSDLSDHTTLPTKGCAE